MYTQDQSSSHTDAKSTLFNGAPFSVCLVDGECRILDLNPEAEVFWGLDAESVQGQPAMEALGIVPSSGGTDAWTRLSGPGARPRIDCRITTPDGTVQPAVVIYIPLNRAAARIGALIVLNTNMADAVSDMLEWAFQDPVTGLGNRHLWEREAKTWAARSGCVVFLDMDDLKEVNDLYGHVVGDRLLAAVGKALAEIAPPDALTVRYGGDEFVVLLPEPAPGAAESWAQEAVRHVGAVSADVPMIPRLSHGVASFRPGGLREAVQRADDVLYERKGVLLPAPSGGRIILTREGRSGLRGPGDDRAQPRPGVFGASFGPEFEAYFHAQYARAADQAGEFVAFVEPEPGAAVVEVGAGSGRISFDGGLANRIGSSGQLLLTDPSGSQLLVARKHAEEQGLDWVRFLRAPAEELPLASDTADLVVGAIFLHFTDPARAIREMKRVVRPGGRLAICAGREFDWPRLLLEALGPVRRELAAAGLPFRHHFLKPGDLVGLVDSAGLQVQRVSETGPDAWESPSAEIAVMGWRQLGLVPLLLRGIPQGRIAALQAEFENKLRADFDRYPRQDWTITGFCDNVVARKPG